MPQVLALDEFSRNQLLEENSCLRVFVELQQNYTTNNNNNHIYENS